MDPILIIGTGLAGYGVAREYRKRGGAAPLHLITSDDGESYSKPMLSNALVRARRRRIWPWRAARAWAGR